MLTTNWKMKKSNLILLGALAAIVFFSLIFQLSVHSYVKEGKANQKPVEVISQTREVSTFAEIKAEGPMKILFEQDVNPALEIMAPNYIVDSIRTKMTNQTLDIVVGSKLKKKDSIIVRIANPELRALTVGSNTHFETVGQISGTHLHLQFNENSSGNLDLKYDSLKHENNSTGTVILNGKVTSINLTENKEE